ncbi:hypothetical protein NEF87_000880 [Candidatus Lokiarchaeum ossiferum]|uniref:Metal-dependent hydrolase n=1 Tax=Candidatus Lokiarchaeum ossiferum TaxID=2951803 RepID=A0ABY6HM59_9ARCH|nr:hypothetical protein NEF87_000880 [Candidatus Lokiarchaeum sp. B-35]
MDQNAHAAHAFWLYQLTHLIIFSSLPPTYWGTLIIIWGNFPDIDALFHLLQKKDPNDMNFQHHLEYWTHWPISYIPIFLMAIISWILNWQSEFFLFLVVGILSHLIADSACCGDGLMWRKIPWKSNQFSPFVNLFSSKTDGYHGGYWVPRWRQTIMFKISIFETILGIFFLSLHTIFIESSFWSIFGILIFLVTLSLSFWPINTKYKEEPPEGRYADYRKNPQYLAWMERCGYSFNKKYQARKKNKK